MIRRRWSNPLTVLGWAVLGAVAIGLLCTILIAIAILSTPALGGVSS